jgi:murein DD-endopeptidase MepM/ murein hydrolase activator NlpD
VVPDLPYVRKDVPGGSEAEEYGFARSGRSRVLLARLAPASAGPHIASARRRRVGPARLLPVIAALLVAGLGITLLAPAATADDLTHQRDRLKQQLAKTKGDLDESSKVLSAAAQAVDRAQAKLDQARAQLAQTRKELAVAQAKDLEQAAKLRQAKIDLAKAKARVALGQKNLDAEAALAGTMIRDQYQQQGNLLPLAVLVDTSSLADLQTRLQWSTTLFDTTQAQIDRLTVIQQQLTAERARQAELEAQVAADRRAAAAALRIKRTLELRAASEEGAVRRLLSQRQAIERTATDDVAQDKARYAQLAKERTSVEQRIAARIAQAKAAAARKAAAERAAAARKASKAHRSTTRHSSSGSSSHSSSHSSSASAAHGFSFPVSAPITSPFGMRFHPILHYWKLHDGTDFGAGCGTPIRAPYPGRVAERYYNAGYGNRLMIDHGFVDGRYVTTGYNHAIGYTVHVGEHVQEGEIIGYVGTTGFSTGCHLHLMVWLDGRVVNPMTWF